MTVTPGLYRHFKGNTYRVIGVALHSETKDLLVIYQREDNADPTIWARPLPMFLETTVHQGKIVPRFSRLD